MGPWGHLLLPDPGGVHLSPHTSLPALFLVTLTCWFMEPGVGPAQPTWPGLTLFPKEGTGPHPTSGGSEGDSSQTGPGLGSGRQLQGAPWACSSFPSCSDLSLVTACMRDMVTGGNE